MLRFDIAFGKAWGALGMGFGSRTLRPRGQDAEVLHHAGGGERRAHGHQSRRRADPDAGGNIIGACGISGDTSDKDEMCAIAGIEAAGLKADPGAD